MEKGSKDSVFLSITVISMAVVAITFFVHACIIAIKHIER